MAVEVEVVLVLHVNTFDKGRDFFDKGDVLAAVQIVNLPRGVVAEVVPEAHLEVVELPLLDVLDLHQLVLVLPCNLANEYRVVDFCKVLQHVIERQSSKHTE